jgi:hypothetical protein
MRDREAPVATRYSSHGALHSMRSIAVPSSRTSFGPTTAADLELARVPLCVSGAACAAPGSAWV